MALELVEQQIDVLKPKCHHALQVSSNEDINVPDVKPDIDKIIQVNAKTNIGIVEIYENKVICQGEIKATVLYLPLNDKKPIHNLDVSIPIKEAINIEAVTEKDDIKVEYISEELSIKDINTRKINVRVLGSLNISVNEVASAAITTNIMAETNLQKEEKNLEYCQMKASGSESYRIKSEIAIPQGKPNIHEILWHDLSIQNNECKALDGKINVKGTLHVSTLYLAEDGENSLQYIEDDISFNGLVDNYEAREDYIHDIKVTITDQEMIIKPDVDGEERVISVEVDTAVDIKLFKEEQVAILSDIYALDRKINIERKSVTYQTLNCKNQSQCNVKESISIDESAPSILQIYNTSAEVIVDSIERESNHVIIEGVLMCKIMYVPGEDNIPVHVVETPIPIEHSIEVSSISEKSIMNVSPTVNYINCMAIDDKEIEIKCAINLNTMIFDENNVDIISEVTETSIDIKEIQSMPGIIGYVVKETDTLWDVAKRFNTTIHSIIQTNHLESNSIQKGDKLVIIKEISV